ASCLVNPRACHETELRFEPATRPRRIAVVGAGPAGLACATVAAGRGHAVTLFEAGPAIGGQFNLARRIPGKEEFDETLRYYSARLEEAGVDLRLGARADPAALGGFDAVVLASGVVPRPAAFPGVDDPRVVGYADVLEGRVWCGPRVAIVGAGGIGFDVAAFLVHAGPSPTTDRDRWMREWGIDPAFDARGGLAAPRPEPPSREVWLLQRSPGRPGARLGRTTGWIHRAGLRAKSVRMLGGVTYLGMEPGGFRVALAGGEQVLPVDHVVVCAGQESCRDLLAPLQATGTEVHVVGGAHLAAEVDARRAIDQASRLAAAL
ncbi:MAG TPA: FAD/NAD(P)-binding oxidoreductase, partial [Vicinamibacterales bacterium]|nr:FAD/NAD(P)-binding oxidoreductase [Vicinamibacterales bacterium]